jgi:uncharacterized protein YdaU (DUF1376 family)
MNPPKMPIHIGDLMRDTAHLRAAPFGSYLALLFHHWSTGELPDDDEQLAMIARMSPAEWRKHKPILEKFFGPGWHHGRVEKDLATAKANYEKRAAAGAEGGKAAAKSKQNPSNATAMLQHPDSNAVATLNHIPKKEDAADAAPDPEVELFRRGREVLGKSGGGLVSKLLAAKQKNIPLARAAIEQASTKSDPREYIGAVIRGQQKSAEPNWLDGIEGVI